MKRVGVVLALWLFLCGAGNWFYVEKASQAQHIQSARLAAKITGYILALAHRANDDLIQQEAVQGLSQAPGVLFAFVVDGRGKVLTSAEPFRLGQYLKTFPRDTPLRSVWILTLAEAATPQGKLVFALSKRTLRQALSRYLGLMVLGNAGTLFLAFWACLQWRREQMKQNKYVADIQTSAKEKDQEIERLQRTHKNSESLWSGWLQSAVEQMTRPALLLGPTQRVIACNRAARTSLGFDDGASPRGRSWQDIEKLAGCGEAVQRSLETPGKEVEVHLNGAAVKICFLSEQAHPDIGLSTWVVFPSDIMTG